MRRLAHQQGSGLILIIGVVAALAILGATLVVFTNNYQHNTYQDRIRAKTFNVAEAAIDAGMGALSAKWPTAAGAGPDVSTAALAAFRSQFTPEENPDPVVSAFVNIEYYDNLTPIDKTITWDKGSSTDPNAPDDRMWLVAQVGMGTKAARIQTLVERTYFESGIPRGVALYTGGNLLSNGGGNNPKIHIEVPPPVGTQTCVKVVGTIDDPTVSGADIVQLTGATAGTVEDVFPAALRAGLTALAKTHGRYFTSVSAAENSPPNGTWSPAGGFSGLCVIEVPNGTSCRLQSVYNSEAEPGILMLLNKNADCVLDFGSGSDYWGVLYTDGWVDKGHGSYEVHGMVVSASTVDIRGTCDVSYNDNVISRLSARWSLNVHLVPNTWRELRPE